MPSTVGDPIAAYDVFGLDFGTSHVPIEPGSLALTSGHQWDELLSAGGLAPDLAIVRGKRLEIAASLLDPSLISAWTAYGATETITSVIMALRAFGERTAGFSTTYRKITSAQGVIIPVSLSGAPGRAAVLNVRILPLFSGGVALSEAATSITAPTISAAYYPTSITIGANGIIEIVDLQVNWDYGPVRYVDNADFEPVTCYAGAYRRSFRATVGDAADATLAAIEDGLAATATALFTDAVGGSSTVSLALGTCRINASLVNGKAVLEGAVVL